MRLLLAIDDSKFSETATQAVIAQCQPQGTEVKVLTGLERFSMGSVSNAVARHAPCSVEVVRIPKS